MQELLEKGLCSSMSWRGLFFKTIEQLEFN